ncbi:MAG TPA: chromosomal replication initiator protein DnaA [Bacteroidales bacterium]|jgi:chromosomal replication initiator protein|nr:chromosomal replication initiator protein DnaA [Bacteroidales bacterium]HOV55777.1 chromosomal replication initiator protein DnaA [Bacteroidales bacterium]HPX46242.1 chromosomal replication initiator protein DnaA [Bacteroidales bacterium]HQC60217.1 chromosomal replication initiator protein DnaA [Bacteroidales bacterium]
MKELDKKITQKNISKLDLLWNNILDFIKENVNSQNFKTWFLPLKPLAFEDNTLTIEVPSSFYYEYIEAHFIDVLKIALKNFVGPNAKLYYQVVIAKENDDSSTLQWPSNDKVATANPDIHIPFKSENNNADKNNHLPNPFLIPGIRTYSIDSNLIETLDFDNFVEGECNRLARAVGLSIANNPGLTSFNPFFLYSATGLGKTHLVNAIGLETRKKFSNKVILYMNTAEFLNQFVKVVKSDNIADFIQIYQSVDLLIMDDIHHLANKPKTQEVFFQIFNSLHQQGKQIILTSDKAPIELDGIEERLLSRFKWGLTAELTKPDYDTRKAIIRKKIQKDGIHLSDEIIDYIAKKVKDSVREIEGVLIAIIAHSTFVKKDLDISDVQSLIDQYIKCNQKDITYDMIKHIVCDYFSISLEELECESRKQQIVIARHMAMYMAFKYSKLTLSEIGKLTGNRKHSSVAYAIKNVNSLLEVDKNFRMQYEEIKKKIIR